MFPLLVEILIWMIVGDIGVDIILKTVGDVDIRVDNNELISGHIFE